MNETCERLARILGEIPARLVQIPEDAAGVRPSPGRWCKKEILGHLIDSAANNHQRFVRGQLAPALEIPSYEQDDWVTAQGYAAEPWPDVLNLWLLYNRHILHILRRLPEGALANPCTIGDDPAVPLAEVASSYVDHLEHHLDQILG